MEKSGKENYSKGTGSGGSSLQNDIGDKDYRSGKRDSDSAKLSSAASKGFKETHSSRKPTQG